MGAYNFPGDRRAIPTPLLVLVLIKDDLFIKRMLTQKASVYPGFFLTSEFTS